METQRLALPYATELGQSESKQLSMEVLSTSSISNKKQVTLPSSAAGLFHLHLFTEALLQTSSLVAFVFSEDDSQAQLQSNRAPPGLAVTG